MLGEPSCLLLVQSTLLIRHRASSVGAQAWSCMECKRCKSDNENYCKKQVDTYNAKYPNGDIAHGGYSTGVRAHQQFVFALPDKLEDKYVAPMLCGGLTYVLVGS